ncbi:3-oxoadipyl-CoA thiolase, partial [Microbacteriaceae bacterium K1510]|nr:3-oxoadipyl-CoA thiolase [Microbacteriaceae bacterium K1510]
AALLAGLPETVPGSTVNRLCGSGLDAVSIAARSIISGEANVIVAGGVESMTRAPHVMLKADTRFQRAAQVADSTIGWRFVNAKLRELYGTDSMGETAENVASEFSIHRDRQDAFAHRSQMRAHAAI